MRKAIVYYIFGTVFLSLGLAVGVANADIYAGLMGHWKLDEESGTTAYDSSGNDYHGTLFGGPHWVAGHVRNGLDLDGTDDYVELPIGSLISSLTNSTFATWVNFSNAGGSWQRVFDFGSNTTINMFLTPRRGTAESMRFAITIGGSGAEEMATAPNILASGWHHVAVTINDDTGTILLYLDGSVVAENASATLTPSDLGNTTQNWLGRSQYSADAYFDGSLDDFRIYNRVLSEDEIDELINWTGGAYAGKDDRRYCGETVPLSGLGPGDATSFSWQQLPGEPRVTFDPDPPNQADVTFVAPTVTRGVILTFRLTVDAPSTGVTTDDVDVAIIPDMPPAFPVSNVRIYPMDKGFWVNWDNVLEAETYDVALEIAPGTWFTYGNDLIKGPLSVVNQAPGKTYGVKVIAKNSKSTPENLGAESQPEYYTVMRNLALPAPDGATPPSSSFDYDGNPVSAMSDTVLDAGVDSSGTAAETEDLWGYTWPNPLYFDRIVYVTGDIVYDGGWFTHMTQLLCCLFVQYTEDGTTWQSVPCQITPPYDLTDSPAGRDDFARYDIVFPVVRGTGIRLFGAPGGMDTFTSIAELEVYGDQSTTNRPANFVAAQGIDAEFAERSTATLDGSYSMSAAGDIVSYTWTAPAGFPYTLVGADTDTATFEAGGVDADETYVFSLTVEDSAANTATDDDVRITIKNRITTAVAGADQQAMEKVEVALDGRGSQSTSETISYQWTAPAGITLSDPTSPTPTFTTPEIWNFIKLLTFQLEVSDDVGGSSIDEVNVVVTNPLFELKPLATYYWTDLLHLGQTPGDRFLLPGDTYDINTDYLANWGGCANVNPVEGDVYDFTDTGINTTRPAMIWTPVHRDNGWFGWNGRAETAQDNFGQIYHIYLFCPEQREVQMRFIHDDEIRIYNNGEVVVARDLWNYVEVSGIFTLDEGVNSMTLRFEDGTGGNVMAVRITDRNDLPYTDLSYALSVPVPLPTAYAVRELPASYHPGDTFDVNLSVRADPLNLPTSIQLRDSIPAGTDVADLGGGTRIGNEIAWTLTGDDVGIAARSYTLTVLSGTTGALNFTGNVSYAGVPEQETFGDNVVYELPSAPRNVGLEILIAGHLSWSANTEDGIAGYRIYRSEDGGDWQEIGFATGTTYVDDTVEEGVSYMYRITAVNQGGAEGAASASTIPKMIEMLVREAEHFNYGGGLYPWDDTVTVAAVEATTADDLDGTDFWHPDKGGPTTYRPLDNVGIWTATEVAPVPGRVNTGVGWIDAGSWWRYTFNVPEPGPEDPEGGWVKLVFRIGALPNQASTLSAYWDETLVGTAAFAPGTPHTFTYAVMEQFPTEPGVHTLRVEAGGEDPAADVYDFDKIGIGFNWTPPTRKAIFEEDFEDWTNLYDDVDAINEGWTLEYGPSGKTDGSWRLWNTTGDLLRDTDPDIGAMTSNYMISDGDMAGDYEMDEGLITPDIDATEYTKLRLNFSKNYRLYLEDTGRQQIAEVDIRTKDPVTQMYSDWTNLLHWDLQDAVEYNMDAEEVDISLYDNNIIQIRWHYYDAQFDYWFAIDDIVVSGEKKEEEVPTEIRQVGIVEGNLELSWSDFADTYYVECTSDLTGGDWSHVDGPITETSWSGDVSAICPGDVVYVRIRGE